MANKKSKIKKVKEMGPPVSAARWPIGDSDMTDAEKQEYYEEALGDVAEVLDIPTEKLQEGIKKTDLPYWKYPDRYGQFNLRNKELTVQQAGHKTPEEYKNTLRHEILHSTGVGHTKPRLNPGLLIDPDTEQFYYRPALMQPSVVNPETKKQESIHERAKKQIKLLKEFGVENPEQVYAETLMANEAFGHGQRQGLAKPSEEELPSEIKAAMREVFPSSLEELAQGITEERGPDWKEKAKRIKRLRERAYPTKGEK